MKYLLLFLITFNTYAICESVTAYGERSQARAIEVCKCNKVIDDMISKYKTFSEDIRVKALNNFDGVVMALSVCDIPLAVSRIGMLNPDGVVFTQEDKNNCLVTLQ